MLFHSYPLFFSVWEKLLTFPNLLSLVTPGDCVTAAKLYRSRSNINDACKAYTIGLARHTAAIEIVIGLLECGKTLPYIVSIWQKLKATSFDSVLFFMPLVEAHAARLKRDYGDARARFEALNAEYPLSDHVLHHLAVTSMQDGYAVQAQEAFKRLRELDPFYVDGMDTYGSIIKLRGTSRALRSLTNDLFAIDTARPEPWCVAAMYAELEGDRQRALLLVDKALEIDSMHVFAYLLRGAILLALNHAQRASVAFYRALSIEKDHSGYQGVVQAHIQLDELPRALANANEAVQLMPRSARALALVGLVLSCESSMHRKARRVLEQSLALRPRCIEAVLALAELDHNEGHYDDAVKRLKEQLVHDVSNAEFIHIKLGEISMKTKPADAIVYFRTALEVNPMSESARSGLALVVNRQQSNNNGNNASASGAGQSPSP